MTIHFYNADYNNFTACMLYTTNYTRDCLITTCFNCIRSNRYQQEFKIQTKKIRNTPRVWIEKNLYKEHYFIGIVYDYDHRNRRHLLRFIRTTEGEFVSDHLWVSNLPRKVPKIVKFKAVCTWYSRKDRSQSYTLKKV